MLDLEKPSSLSPWSTFQCFRIKMQESIKSKNVFWVQEGQIWFNPTLDGIQLYILWTGGRAHCAPPPFKYLRRASLGSNQLVTQKVDKFLAVKWKKVFFSRVSQNNQTLKKIKFFLPPKNTQKHILRLFCAVHFFYLTLYFQNISIFWL